MSYVDEFQVIGPRMLAQCEAWAHAVEPLLAEATERRWVRIPNDGQVIRTRIPLFVHFVSYDTETPGKAWTVRIAVPQEGYEYTWDAVASAEVAAAVADLRHAGMP